MIPMDGGEARALLRSLEPARVPIYDARPARGSLRIDRHGAVIDRLLHTNLRPNLEDEFKGGLLGDEDYETEIREVHWPEIEDLVKKSVETDDGRFPKYAFVLNSQKFTENGFQSDGFYGTYNRFAHTDFSDVVFDKAYKMFTKRGVPEDEARSS